MITTLSPLLSRVSTEVKPEDLLLSKGAWVYFDPAWPDTWDWAKGKLFSVAQEPILVKYPVSYILPGADYKNIDLSNATGGLKLYPEEKGVLYQTAVGFKPGDYIVNVYIPGTNQYVYSLGDATMYPQVADATLRYLGAREPKDSPADAPLLYFYLIEDGPKVYLQPYVLESVTFEKVTLEFYINKCQLKEISSPTPDQINKATRIAHFTQLTGF